MLKCNLEDLEIISAEEARYAGFRGQMDFYLYLLATRRDLDEANAYIHVERDYRADHLISLTSQSEHCIVTNLSKDYVIYADICLTIQNNLKEILSYYPDFFKFLDKIRNVQSRTFVHADALTEFRKQFETEGMFTIRTKGYLDLTKLLEDETSPLEVVESRHRAFQINASDTKRPIFQIVENR